MPLREFEDTFVPVSDNDGDDDDDDDDEDDVAGWCCCRRDNICRLDTSCNVACGATCT